LCRSYAQPLSFYNSPEDDSGKYKEWMNATEKRYQQDILSLTGKNKKYLVELYKERFDMIRKMYDQKEIVAAGEPNAYLQSLYSEIVKSNPTLQQLEARVAFSRAWWPNASSMGEGTILFNIGLFHKLQNESQAAFVICHELAHLYLRHSNNNIDRFVNTVHSEEFQQEIKRIEKSQYKQGQQLDALVKTLTFRSRKHSREYEAQADSMALEWMKNTAFDVQEVLSCLHLLDSVDGDKYRVSPGIDRVLNCKEYPFQAKWIKEEKTLFSAMAANSEAAAKKEQDS
jgi:predicted Zn-dependent protease